MDPGRRARPRRGLVLGAGGYAAMAWEIGFLAGMAEGGVDPREADLFVGTSAGAIVAAQITSGAPLEELQRRLLEAPTAASPSAPPVDFRRWREDILRAVGGGGTPTETLRRIGQIARKVPPGATSDRATIDALLPRHAWPPSRLLAVAVDAGTGERRVFDRASGIDLVEAVLASGAVAGIDPPVTFQGHGYVDGGFYSTANADLALGCASVLVLALRARQPPLSAVPLESALESLRAAGARVKVVHPDEAAEAAFAAVGGNVLDPAVRGPALRAGREQGRRAVEGHASSFWP